MTPADKARLEALLTEQIATHRLHLWGSTELLAVTRAMAANVAMAAYELGCEAQQREDAALRAQMDALGRCM